MKIRMRSLGLGGVISDRNRFERLPSVCGASRLVSRAGNDLAIDTRLWKIDWSLDRKERLRVMGVTKSVTAQMQRQGGR